MTGRLAVVRTGREISGLVRGRDERCRADETRKGKGKGDGGKGEHEGKGGVGRKGTQHVENSVMDEIQENHKEDVRKLVEMMQKEEEDQEGQRGRVAPNMGAGGSHPRAMSVPERRKETQGMRWADCEDCQDEGKEEEEGEGEGETEGEEERERKKEKETRQETGHREEEREESAGGARGREESAGGAREESARGAGQSAEGAGRSKGSGGAKRRKRS